MPTLFPAALDTEASLLKAVNILETQLNGALANDANGNNGSATEITVVSTAGFPAAGLILIDAEVISYTGITATKFTGQTRAQDGTVTAAHITLSLVKNAVVAAYHNLLRDAIIAIETAIIPKLVLGAGMLDHVTFWGWNWLTKTQGTWVLIRNAVYFLGFQFYNSSNTQNDQIDYIASFSGGNYSIRIMFIMETSNADFTVLVDGVSVGVINGYGAEDFNAVGDLINIPISAGSHIVSIKAASRNGAATGWYLTASSITLFRTS